MLVVLIALPGIAICWNFLPKDLWLVSAPSPVAAKVGKSQPSQVEFVPPASQVSVFSPASIQVPSSVLQTPPQAILAPTAPLQASQHPPIQQVSWEPSSSGTPPGFETLEFRLKALGATYYRLEKWGNRGELFRLSCFVAPTENPTYTKHFQAIGSDVVAVMQTVITEIEKWKNAR